MLGCALESHGCLETAYRLPIQGKSANFDMLWKPATYGEEAFLAAYEGLGRHLILTARHPMSLDFLFSEQSFQEFARLHATIELFIRCVRAASFIYAQFHHLPAPEFGKLLGRRGYLSRRLSDDRRFCELIKQS